MINWDLNAGNNNSNSGGKTNYTKFPEGITKIRLLLGNGEQPYMRWTHWMPQFKRKLTCPGYGCPIDEIIKQAKISKTPTPYSSSRSYAVNIWNYDTGQVEIMEEGITMIEGLLDSLKEWYEEEEVQQGTPINEIVIKVRKKINSSGKSAWSFNIDRIEPMNEEELAAFDKRIDFKEYFTPPTIEQVQEILLINEPDEKTRIEKYNEIMGFAKKDILEEVGVEIE